MASLVRASVEFTTRKFHPRTIFAVFERWLLSLLHSF